MYRIIFLKKKNVYFHYSHTHTRMRILGLLSIIDKEIGLVSDLMDRWRNVGRSGKR